MVSGDGSSSESAVETYDEFFRRVYRPLVALGASLTGSVAAGEDLAQDALIAAHGAWDRVSRLEHPAGWVRRLVTNRAISQYRRSVRAAVAQSRVVAVAEASPLDHAVRSDVWVAVRSLPRRQRAAVALRYLHGLTLEEIAADLGCSKSTANTHLRRAHERLARSLGSAWRYRT